MDIQSSFIYIISGGEKRWWASCLRGLLRGFSWIYALCVNAIRYFYHQDILKRYTIARPVVCVGNVTCGGCGKTPLVAYCAKAFQEKGFQPAVLMRGYMPKKWEKWGTVPKRGLSPLSDEAGFFQKTLPGVPVIVNPDRVQGAMDALARGNVDVFLMDDGFQHWRVKRDLDIVAVDATNPFGYGAVLPRGLLREPLSGLKRAGIVVITRADLVEEKKIENICMTVKRFHPDVLIVKAVHEPLEYVDLRTGEKRSLTVLNACHAGLVSAIGNPYAFTKTMERLGVNCAFHHSLKDHHVYCRQDIDNIVDLINRYDVKTLVMTEKDSEKFKDFLNVIDKEIDVLVLRVDIAIQEGKHEFEERLQRLLCA